jgi:hypothetical protein
MDDISGAGTAYPSGAPEFTPPVFSGVRATQSLVLCVCFVDYLSFDLQILINPFGIFKLFLNYSKLTRI